MLTHVVQDVLIQYGCEWDVRSSKVREVGGTVNEWSGYNELYSSEEGAEVFVKVVLLLTSLAGGSRPQINGVGGDAHVDQPTRGGDHDYQAPQYDHRGMAHAEGTPAAEEDSQCILEAFAETFTT